MTACTEKFTVMKYKPADNGHTSASSMRIHRAQVVATHRTIAWSRPRTSTPAAPWHGGTSARR